MTITKPDDSLIKELEATSNPLCLTAANRIKFLNEKIESLYADLETFAANAMKRINDIEKAHQKTTKELKSYKG